MGLQLYSGINQEIQLLFVFHLEKSFQLMDAKYGILQGMGGWEYPSEGILQVLGLSAANLTVEEMT